MKTGAVVVPPLSVELSTKDRHTILETVLAALRKRFYSPEKRKGNRHAAVDGRIPLIESAASTDAFGRAVSDLLGELHTRAACCHLICRG